jgi:cell division protein FtsB
VNLRRVVISLYFALFLGVAVTSGIFFWRAQQEYNRLRVIEAESRRKLVEAELRLREQEKILDRLRTDPTYVEKIIRQRLGYAQPGEFIFRFKD